MEQTTKLPNASFKRRLIAGVYDLFFVVAIYIVAASLGFVIVAVLVNAEFLNLGEHKDIAGLLDSEPYKAIYQCWIFFWIIYFYVYFWSYGGQTLGMRAWRLKIHDEKRRVISFPNACIRFFFSFLGIGNILILFRKDKLALQDIASKSYMVVLTKELNQLKNWHDI